MEIDRKALEDRDVRTGRVVEFDVLEGDTTDALFGTKSTFVGRVDGGDTVDGSEDLCCGCLSVCDGLGFRSEESEGE